MYKIKKKKKGKYLKNVQRNNDLKKREKKNRK